MNSFIQQLKIILCTLATLNLQKKKKKKKEYFNKKKKKNKKK